MTLYLKYRPQSVSELDLVEVRETLAGMLGEIKDNGLAHAWLFCGPRGTGKTSSARILAKAINCESGQAEPCNKCEMCREITAGTAPDVVEMDAASNRGIDEIRELRERVALAPMRAKFKVYIIDEAHMLTTEAANALLKTLEEPPAHAVFILCTTEPEKLPETVVSRCAVVKFKKPSIDEVVEKLKKINKIQGWGFTTGDLEMIAKAAKGSFRDAIKILEQVQVAGGNVKKTLGGLEAGEPEKLLELVRAGEAKEAIGLIGRLVDQGANLRLFVEEMVESLRSELLSDLGKREEILPLISGLDKVYEQMRTAAVIQLPLEIFVVERGSSVNSNNQETHSTGSGQAKTKQIPITKKPIRQAQGRQEPKGGDGLEELVKRWPEVLKLVRPKNHSVEALLRSTRPVSFDGHELEVEAFYEFHKKQLETEKCRKIVEAAVAEVVGVDGVVLRLKLGAAAKKNVEPNIASVEDEELVAAAQEIFK